MSYRFDGVVSGRSVLPGSPGRERGMGRSETSPAGSGGAVAGRRLREGGTSCELRKNKKTVLVRIQNALR